MSISKANPGSLIEIRNSVWKVLSKNARSSGTVVLGRGVSSITKGKTAQFVLELERNFKVLDPISVDLHPDESNGFTDTKLFLEAAFRSAPPSGSSPLTLGKAAIDDLAFQHLPVKRALAQDRVRLLIADDVGLGKTLEAGLITSELLLRGRADRILVVTTRSMLTQFQKEFWTRFSIPLSRLDGAAIKRMQNEIPAHYNVFDQFDRSIVSIDTLKKNKQIREALGESRWDLVIIDEAHNAARRIKSGGSESLRAKLASLLSSRTDSLLLLTATPHDGSQGSFASLIEMLDPTRVPDPEKLQRDDIDDLVIRRFRSSPEVIDAIKKKVKERVVKGRRFPLSRPEEDAHQLIADLDLELDREASGKGRAMDLFRTTLAKAIFSSPIACLETVEGRLRRIASGHSRGTAGDVIKLEELATALRRIGTHEFSKYQDLLRLIHDLKWNGKNKRDRLVIFSERIASVSFLEERLSTDLGLAEGVIGRIDGGSLAADDKTQKLLEDFGQENAPIRILIASDMASEGLNLHFQSHRLIHFDLPWSLLRYQQRNGRIDRYGQDRTPEIYYFVGESTHEKVRDMWVLEKLVEKDQAAQKGLGDPAVFLGVGDADREEEVVAEAVAGAVGGDRFSKEMDARASEAHAPGHSDEWDLLFGDFTDAIDSAVDTKEETGSAGHAEDAPPRLYSDTFEYACAMVSRLARPGESAFPEEPRIRVDERIITFPIPEDMMSDGSFGYARKGDVDDRYMPVEAVGRGNRIELTDRIEVINEAISQAKTDERSWPLSQYLWDGHPILSWFSDRSESLFPGRSVPLCNLEGRLPKGEVAVLLHGAIPNRVGHPVVDRWGVVRVHSGVASSVAPVEEFLRLVRFDGDIPNRGPTNSQHARAALVLAVDRFQSHIVEARKQRATEMEAALTRVLDRLSGFEKRFQSQLAFEFADLAEGSEKLTIAEQRKLNRRAARSKQINAMFDDWAGWFRDTCEMVADPNPHVDIKAVFVG